ncbi:response regulator [Roseateles sp. BYS180W]|uniref:Response regulator n=1 Tax=Roseateles rivi TaxID=3299028 RepID=A0ABW7FQZ0_9BURK
MTAVLLVEDDASLQRFVQLVCEDLALTLVCVDHVDAALQRLRAQSFELILSDLMLPQRHGLELLELLMQDPSLRAGARLAVFSAGLTPQVRSRLEALGITHLLSKPCGVKELQACLLGTTDTSTEPTVAEASTHQFAIDQHFGGNRSLYERFRASCVRQFPLDAQALREALAQCQATELRQRAHSLKSVVNSLGHPELGAYFRALEDGACAMPPDWQGLARIWAEAEPALLALR